MLDLSALNKSMQIDKFKMETTKSIRGAIRQNDWAVSIDLKGAYLHVPIHPSSRKYLRFVWRDQNYQFKVLPFGISTAPRVFTKLMTAIAAEARKQGVLLFQYFDDWLIHQQSKELVISNLKIVWRMVTDLGLIPNEEKSELVPTQDFNYVGMNFRTTFNVVRVPLDRIQNTLTQVFKALNMVNMSARELLSLLGVLGSTANLIRLGRLHMRPLQTYLLYHWRPHYQPLELMIPLSKYFKRHLRWWAQRSRYMEGVPMREEQPSLFLITDASASE